MGYPKALMSIDNMPAILFSLNRLVGLNLACISVTMPWSLLMDADFCCELVLRDVRVMPNYYGNFGYAGSIKTVLSKTQEDVAGIIINPVDTPLYSRQLLVAMVNLATSIGHEPAIIVPYFFAQAGHPVYVSRHFFNDFNGVQAPPSLRGVINNHPNYVRTLLWPDGRITVNINDRGEHLKHT
jgi:CTP:molybdopterin cytidylyltransferase MocA